MPYKDPEKQKAYQRAWQQKAIDAGLCRTCRQPRKRSKYKNLCTRCGNVHKKANARWSRDSKGKTWKAEWRRARIAQGLCPNCGDTAMKGKRLCRRCRNKENLMDQQRRRDARTWWSARSRDQRPVWWRP